MADTGRSRIISLDIPSVLDLRTGQLPMSLSANVRDPDGVREVVIYYDRPLATTSGAYSLQIIHGWGDDWADGAHSYTEQVLPHNIGGPLNITHAVVTDNQGNRTEISAAALRNLGVDTSIDVISVNPDTAAPVLRSLDFSEVNIAGGDRALEFAASGRDATEIAEVVIFFDRELSYTFSTQANPTYSTFSLAGLYGYGADDWSDGRSASRIFLGPDNLSGTVDVTRVQITDIYGNIRNYSNTDLLLMGLDTSFEIAGGTVTAPVTYVEALPDVITIREGRTADAALNFIGMTNHWVSYEYEITTVGGTAGPQDIGTATGRGSISVASTVPSDRTQPITISARRDGFAEDTETAWLTVQLGGNMRFADGGSFQRVQIRIIDDNLTTGTDGNDVLRGTGGVDILRGGRGNDSYYVTAGDRVVEAAGGGIDTVYSDTRWSLHQNVENLVLTGTANIAGIGNALNNHITGNSGNNTLNGGLGADTMQGGLGNDIYIVDNLGDRVVELVNQGTDTVRSTVNFTLGANVENLVLLGNAALAGTGNALNNRITGNASDNVLRGGQGADTLDGGAGSDRLVGGLGADRLIGGAGADVFVFENILDSRPIAIARDTIVDFNRAQGDRIDLSAIDANTTLTGNQAFAFIGNAGFSETAGELRTVRMNGALFVNGDVNGDGVADFSVQVNLPVGLIAADFIL